ncbi:hypothetical protein COI68_28230, partial [Priestia megaterium]
AIGKHSGAAALAHVLGQNGRAGDRKMLAGLLADVRRLAVEMKATIPPDDLVRLFDGLQASPDMKERTCRSSC